MMLQPYHKRGNLPNLIYLTRGSIGTSQPSSVPGEALTGL